MAYFTYSFCISLLHSIWQMSLACLVFFILNKTVLLKAGPTQKRNLLYLILGLQLTVSLITFFSIDSTLASSTLVLQSVNNALHHDWFLQLSPWLFACYCMAIIIKTIQVLNHWTKFKTSYRQGLIKPSTDLTVFTKLHVSYFGIKRKVTLWLSNNIHTPITFGLFKPVILLPVALVNQLSIEQTETLILHELSHIKSNDYLLNWFLIGMETIFFFNPFVLSICRQIRMEREKSCDQQVIDFKYSPVLYAETLLKAEKLKQFLLPNFQLAAVGKKEHLLERIQFFSNPQALENRINRKIFLPLIYSSLLLVFALFTFTIVGKQEESKSAISTNSTRLALANTINELNNPVFINNMLSKTAVMKEAIENAAAAIEKQKPAIEKQIEKITPTIKALAMSNFALDSIRTEIMPVIPVAMQTAEGAKQIIINEEQSGSKNASIRVFNLNYINGQWIMTPAFKATAKERLIDSSIPFDAGAE